MATFTLTQLQYSEDRKGPWKLYIYIKDSTKYDYAKWFARKIKYPDEEISIADAFADAMEAIHGDGREVKVCDGGDMLVFHSKDRKTLYGDSFWPELLKPEKEEMK
jgi:hypothetical protein